MLFPLPNLDPTSASASTPSSQRGLRKGRGSRCAELSAGLFPDINTCVKTPGRAAPPTTPALSSARLERRWGCQAPAGCGLLHPLVVVAMTLRVPTDCRGSLKQLPGVGVHTPALPALPVHSHLALEREKRRPWRTPAATALSPSLQPVPHHLALHVHALPRPSARGVTRGTLKIPVPRNHPDSQNLKLWRCGPGICVFFNFFFFFIAF